jgi:hypothetical protein
MKTYTIKQKMSGTGTIHEIESDLYDRDINFPAGCRYAVVLAAYYGGKGYTSHKTIEAAIRRATAEDCICTIIDTGGNVYDRHNGRRL